MTEQGPYELVIVGGGPAGMTAGVYAARKQLRALMLTTDIGGQATWSSGIENYLGYAYISGAELVQKFEEHLHKFDIKVEFSRATDIDRADDGFTVQADSGNEFHARAVIIATGKSPKLLGVPGEKEYAGRGVTYCATCDGPLYAGLPVAVVGAGNSGLDAAVQLMKTCPAVSVIEYEPEMRGDCVVQDQVLAAKNVEVLANTKVTAIKGDQLVQSIEVRDRASGEAREIPVRGVFVEVGLTPNVDFARRLVTLNEDDEIVVDCAGGTGVPGLYAAGDVTNVPEKQIIIAAGDGAKAALQAYSYLVRNPAVKDWGP